MTNEHTSSEKYTSHTLCERVAKGLCVRGELETEQTATYWPPFPMTIAALLSYSAGLLNRGSWGTSPLQGAGSHCLELQLELQLQLTPTNLTLRGTGLYNCFMSTCFLWAWHLHRIQPVHGQGYILRSSTGCTCFSIDGWVEGLYVTRLSKETKPNDCIFNQCMKTLKCSQTFAYIYPNGFRYVKYSTAWNSELWVFILFYYYPIQYLKNIIRLYCKDCPWCNGYRRRKWTRRHEFKSWTRLIAFHIALIPLGKVWIQVFSLQLWVNSRADWILQLWWGN